MARMSINDQSEWGLALYCWRKIPQSRLQCALEMGQATQFLSASDKLVQRVMDGPDLRRQV